MDKNKEEEQTERITQYLHPKKRSHEEHKEQAEDEKKEGKIK